MPVIGFGFTSFEAKKGKSSITGEIKVNSTPKILNVREVTMNPFEKKALTFDFDFTTTYAPDVAEIKVGGELLYLAEPAKNNQILKKWKKDKKLPDELSAEILNHLFRRCLIKISNMAEDLQLPPPIALPRVSPKKSEEPSYVG